MDRRTFLQSTTAAGVAAALPAGPALAAAEPLGVFSNGRDVVVARDVEHAKELLAMVYVGKPLAELTPDELRDYIFCEDAEIGWHEFKDLSVPWEIGSDDEPEPRTQSLREWIDEGGEGHLCTYSEYC